MANSLGRRIWNGPFAAPPLQQPVSVGWVLLKVLETLWRLLVILAVLGGLLAAWVYIDPIVNPPLRNQLAVLVRDNDPGCAASPTKPIGVEVRNRSKVIVGEWLLEMNAYEEGRSSDLADRDYVSNPIEMDALLYPGTVAGFCFPRPALTSVTSRPITYVAQIGWAFEVSDERQAPPPIVTVPVKPEKAGKGPS